MKKVVEWTEQYAPAPKGLRRVLKKGEKKLDIRSFELYIQLMNRIFPAEAAELSQACIADKLRLLNRIITQLYDETLRPVGLTTSQMNILVVVARYGEASRRQVGDWLHMEKSTLSRNVHRLQQNGWLTILESAKGRTHSLKLTPKGNRALQKGLPLWESAQQEAQAILGKAGIQEIMRIAGTVRSTSG